MKKKLAILLVLGLLSSSFCPMSTLAISDKSLKAKKAKTDFVKSASLTRKSHLTSSSKNKKELKQEQARQKRFAYINYDWWQDYNDTYLSEYIIRAFENNQDLKIATLKVEQARLGTKLQLANELPNLTVGVSPLLYKMPGVNNTEGIFSVPVLASYELDLFLKNHDKTKSSKKTYEASKFSEKAAYITIISAVGATYYNIVKLDEMIDIQRELIVDRNKIYELMKESNELGIISTADLVKADKARVIASTDLIDYEKARDSLLYSLAVLIGDSPNNIKEYKRISYKDLKKQKSVPKEISSEIITSRPDYLIAEKMVEKAGIDVRVAKKEFLPTINIIGLLSFASGSALPSMSWNSTLAALAGNAALNLFTGGKKIANLKIQKNVYEQAIETYYKTNLKAIQEVNDALSNLKLDDEKYKKNLKTLAMERKDFGYTQDRYNSGIISYLDLLQRKETLLSIEKLVAASKMDCYVNQISLYKAVAAAEL